MPRPAVLLGIISLCAAGLLAVGLLWHFAQISPASHTTAPHAPPASRPAALDLGPRYRANTIIPDPFPQDPSLAPTRVSIDLAQATVSDALDELASSAGLSAAPLRFPPVGRLAPRIDMHLDDQPWLEAYLQLQAQASVNIPLHPELSASYTPQKTLPGAWCVSGPFAFVISAITHMTYLGPDGQPSPRFAGEAPELFYISITIIAEPKLHLLQFPGQLHFLEVTDENDHSLIPTGPPIGSARFDQPLVAYYSTLTSRLSYPHDHPGRTITRLKATAEVLVESKVETLEITDPMDTPAPEKQLGGMTISVGKLTVNPQNHWLNLAVTYHRGSVPADTWAALCPALVGARLNLLPAAKTRPSISGFRSDNRVADPITTTYTIPPDNMQGTASTITKITLDIPTAVRQLSVPLEFKNLPLP